MAEAEGNQAAQHGASIGSPIARPSRVRLVLAGRHVTAFSPAQLATARRNAAIAHTGHEADGITAGGVSSPVKSGT
jgi:hypothetical protein